MPQAQHFDWHLIPSFLAVLDAGSLTGAARISGSQQPTLSRHISELEAQLGVALFERTGRGALPTAAALSLASSARHMHVPGKSCILVASRATRLHRAAP